MKCLILAAGYATRLYPLTKDFPKPLLEIGGKTILDRLIDDISKTGIVNEYIVVTNHRFAHIFNEWANNHNSTIRIIDDGTSANETRLGAVCDIQFALDIIYSSGNPTDDYLIMAGDNLLDFSLAVFIDFALKKKTSCTMRYFEQDTERLKKSGISEIGENDILISLEEKPTEPKSNWCTPPFYYYTKEDVEKIKTAIEDGCGTDAPGSLAAWMCRHSTVHSMLMPGRRYDIGNIESYNNVKMIFEREEKNNEKRI